MYLVHVYLYFMYVITIYYINEYYNLRKSVFLWILTPCIWDFKVFKTSQTVFHYEKLRPRFKIDLFYVVRQTHQNLAFLIWIFWKIDCPCHIKTHLDNVIVSVNVNWKLSPPPPKKKESYNPSHHEKIRVGVHQTYRLLLHVNDVALTQFCILYPSFWSFSSTVWCTHLVWI